MKTDMLLGLDPICTGAATCFQGRCIIWLVDI